MIFVKIGAYMYAFVFCISIFFFQIVWNLKNVIGSLYVAFFLFATSMEISFLSAMATATLVSFRTLSNI